VVESIDIHHGPVSAVTVLGISGGRDIEKAPEVMQQQYKLQGSRSYSTSYNYDTNCIPSNLFELVHRSLLL
jgi:hypothetical protein